LNSLNGIFNPMNNEHYEAIVRDIEQRFAMKIINDVPQLSLNRDRDKLAHINLLPDELLSFIWPIKDKFIDFSVGKLQKFSGLTFRSEQECAPNEELVDGEDDGREEVIGYPKNFLILYMIEFYILCQAPDHLNSYLNYARVSGAKKYGDDLKKIFAAIS